MAGPIKRSVMIAGHPTSVSLEPVFWEALKRAAEADSLPISALVARIDVARIEAEEPVNLASAIRVWLMERALEASDGRPSA
ncbi:MAG: ribbon-helix-helix domain-containing protein [Sphingomonadales bacterium]|nr:ribbon-helix-helix domain-containing protein [Sphingomonadales bacterium]